MADLTDKFAAVNMLIDLENEFQQYKPFHGFEHAMYRKVCEAEMAIGKLPAVDAVEVVICKDCMHWREESLWCDMNSKDRGEHYNWYAEDFCSYGERREENAAD